MISIGKSRGAAVDAVTILEDNDVVGRILFSSADGVDYRTISAEIRTQVDGTPGANNVPGSLYFKTNDGSANDPINRMFISASGEVGIGTTSPDTLLNLKDTGGIEVRLEADSNNSGQEDCFIRFFTDGKTQEGIVGMDNNNSSTLFGTNTENAMVFGCVSNLPVLFATNDTERMQITSGGNVGINTTTVPVGTTAGGSAKYLSLKGNGAGAVIEISEDIDANTEFIGGVDFVNANNADGSNNDADSKLVAFMRARIATSDTNAHDDSGGYIEIATKPEAGALAVNLKIDENGFVIINENDTGSAGSTLKQLSLGTSSSTVIDFTNVATMAGAIVSNSHADQNTGCGIVFTHRTSSSGISFITSRNEGSDASSLHFGTRGSGGVEEEFRIDKDGNLTATDTSIGSLSDKRMKEEIADYTGGLDIIKNLKPRTFKWKEKTKAHNAGKTGTRRGFIAQEILETDDYYVREEEMQENETGYEYIKDTGKMYTAKLNDIDAMYISAIKELSNEITNLKKEIEDLKN